MEKHPDIVTRETLGTTIQVSPQLLDFTSKLGLCIKDRKLDMVTITQKEESRETMKDDGGREVKKRTILVMARIHPGESPASYVIQGRNILNTRHTR